MKDRTLARLIEIFQSISKGAAGFLAILLIVVIGFACLTLMALVIYFCVEVWNTILD